MGKSTLMNRMLGEKIAITSAKPQTTLNRITGIYTDLEYENGEGLQMVFLDTPGIHKPHNKLGQAINETAVNTLNGVDVVLLIVDGTLDFGRGDEAILRLLETISAPKILAINKTDLIGPEKYLELYNRYDSTGLFDDIYGVSALKGDNIDMLRDRLAACMNEGPMYYPDDIATEDPVRFIVSEIIREKLMNYLDDEVPHGVFVEIESFKEPEDPRKAVEISAVIYCEKESHKGIVIGKGASKIKEIRTAAVRKLSEIYIQKIDLDLQVKVDKNWRQRDYTLNRLIP